MLHVGRYTNSGIVEQGDLNSSKPAIYAKNNDYGQRWGWITDIQTGTEYTIHDQTYVSQPPIDTRVIELVPGIRRGAAGHWLQHDRLVVFELRDTPTTQRYHRAVSGWTTFEVYQAAMMQLIRDKVPFEHQPAVNRLVKLLFKQAAGKEVRISQILAQFKELLKLGCPARFLLDLQGLFWTDLSIQEINNPLAVELAPAPS